MTHELSKERLEKIASWREKYGAGHNVMLSAEEAEAMARFILTAYEQEPEAYMHIERKDAHLLEHLSAEAIKSGRYYPLYSHPAPSIPTVPDLTKVISELETVFDWILNTLPVPTKSAVPNARRVGDALTTLRAAMLQAEPQSAPQNIPAGYALVPIDATRAMIDAAERVEEDGYDAMLKAMLAAAPMGV